MTTDPHAALRDRALDRALRGPGESDSRLRQAAAEGLGVPAEFQPLVDKIHRHACKVTDEDVARVQAVLGDDRAFEVVVSAAMGASWQRLRAGLAALEDA